MRWWRLAVGAALLVWVLGTAYYQARRRGHRIGAALALFGLGLLCFVAAAFVPKPPLTDADARGLVIASVVLLAAAMALVLFKGFVARPKRP